MDSQNRIRKMIVEELAWAGSPAELTADFQLIENDVLDSLGVYQMVSMIQDEFGIEIDDLELVRENFETIEAMSRLVDSKVG